ncbi:uncharacterized protein HMPREF1541_09980 [Cyphellophora europaea CBS 101466]|uniref:Uncharacterized protein n=1 Tax=Cyphellophora europaea (strain CBS 101466) TaxID=1220924 RepID=W2SB06_CYPE1|nr:uncharacterized protein HMPREF1541_09980 [Cyphellophora europaea CBS 101466]ETN45104.1 hypothetical protein HMPREF1541_09980 [Cyphellophora europaea CBS 101466]
MPARSLSTQRFRGWSSESFDPVPSATVIEDKTARPAMPEETIQQPLMPHFEPRRQPSGPPTGTTAQKDAGFARFLRKHSSPTHNRVTAGGRIVPMEKRDSPPKFDLSRSQTSAEAFQHALKIDPDPSGSVNGTPLSFERDTLNHFQTQIAPPSVVDREDGRCRVPPQDTGARNEQLKSETADLNHTQAHDLHSSAMPFVPVFEPHYVTSHLPSGSNFYTLQQLDVTFPPNRPFEWPYGGGHSPVGVAQDIFDGVEPTTRLLVSSQTCLVQAEIHFNNLDRQLKAIDRHRAMSSHDPNLAAQRYAIVEKRAEAKELVTRLSAQVEALQFLKGPLIEALASSGLMASAQPFVPQSNGPQSRETSRPPTAGGSVDLSIDADRGFVEKHPSAGKRVIIPIVAPPPSSPSISKSKRGSANKELSTSPVREGTPWGIYYRPASGTTSLDTMRRHAPSIAKNHIDRFEDSYLREPQIFGWTGDRPDPLPAELEAWTELYYDALRLPDGVITVFTLDDGDVFEVCGANLQQPRSGRGSAVEHEYWKRKPAFTNVMLDNLRAKARIVNDEQYEVNYLLGLGDGNDVVSIRSEEGGVQLSKSANIQEQLEKAIRIEAGRRQQTASAPETVPAMSTSENLVISDCDLSTKGYSSVSVQNVNATVRLPPSLDGAPEIKSRDAKAILTAASKNRSPRFLHRSVTGAGAWYGPYWRKAVATDD